MTDYDTQRHDPPAALGVLSLRTLDGPNVTVGNVRAILDTGSDATLLPRWAVEQLGIPINPNPEYSLEWIDGTKRLSDTVYIEVTFLGGHFEGTFAVIDQFHGIVGRNFLNHFRLLFDGPAKVWKRT